MSHVAVRIVANFLEDASSGANACAAAVPRVGSDEAPPTATIYDETQDAWVMRGLAPDDADALAGISFPAVVVKLAGINWEAGRGTRTDTGVVRKGIAQIAVQHLLRADDTVDGVTDSMYLGRGISASLLLLDNATDATRTLAATRIEESMSMQQVKMKPERGDLVCASAYIITYPVWETTPATA